jgi:hypothetical protein
MEHWNMKKVGNGGSCLFEHAADERRWALELNFVTGNGTAALSGNYGNAGRAARAAFSAQLLLQDQEKPWKTLEELAGHTQTSGHQYEHLPPNTL